jgi:hypothetical protein
MVRMRSRERVRVLERRRDDVLTVVLVEGGMIALLALLAVLFVVMGPS